MSVTSQPIISFIDLPINSKGKTADLDDVAALPPQRFGPKLNPLFAKGPTADEIAAKKAVEQAAMAAEQQKMLQRAFGGNNVVFEKIGVPTTSLLTRRAVCQNAFLSTVHEAFANERELVLAPDHIWALVAQAVAIHVNVNAEALRGSFVTHEGKKEIEILNDALVRGDANSPWELCFPLFANELNKAVVGGSADLLPQFSTSGATEQIVHTIAFMDTVKAFFNFTVSTRCGIPRVTLLGTVDDWLMLRERAAALLIRVKMVDIWWARLSPILDQFCALADGSSKDVEFWGKIYYELEARASGASNRADGWIVDLFPYTVNRQQLFVRSTFGSTAQDCFPSSINSVPFTWDYYGNKIAMKFYGGAIGVGEIQGRDAVTPSLAWSVAYA